MTDLIKSRRDKLAEQLEAGRAEYARIEALLVELRRQLDGMYGGLQELDGLLSDDALAQLAPRDDAPSGK